jgi:hypothetical protein
MVFGIDNLELKIQSTVVVYDRYDNRVPTWKQVECLIFKIAASTDQSVAACPLAIEHYSRVIVHPQADGHPPTRQAADSA